jgi:hypothetical protein
MKVLLCSYCNGRVVWNEHTNEFQHTTTEQRITNISPGDYVSTRHNQAGGRVLAVDICEGDDDYDGKCVQCGADASEISVGLCRDCGPLLSAVYTDA